MRWSALRGNFFQMITEYFGLPGSGKTYLAEQYSCTRGTRLIEARGYCERYMWAIFFFCVRPRACATLLGGILRENKHAITLLRHKMCVLYLNTIAKEGKAFFSRKESIIDEGFAQAILSLYEREVHAEELFVFEKLFRGRKVCLVVTPPAKREERMRARARFPRAFLGEEYRARWFPILEKNHTVISGWIKKNFHYMEMRNE